MGVLRATAMTPRSPFAPPTWLQSIPPLCAGLLLFSIPEIVQAQAPKRDKISPMVTWHQGLKQRPQGMPVAAHQQGVREQGLNPTNLGAEDCAIYCEKRLTPAEIAAFALQGIRINPEVWIPPVPGTHPNGFHLASVDFSSLDTVRQDARITFLESTEIECTPLNDLGRARINADDVFAGNGVTARTGTGIKIAVADSGLDVNHGDIPTPVEAYDVTDGTTIATWGTNVANTASAHGTHVVGTVLGSGALSGGTYRGAAPGASLYFYKIGNDTNARASFTDMIEALNRAVAVGVDIFTMSYGGYSTYMDGSESMEQAIDSAVASGVTVFISAGNAADDSEHDSMSVAPGAVSSTFSYSLTNFSTTTALTTAQIFQVMWRDGNPGDSNITMACTNLGSGETFTQTFSSASSRGTDGKFYSLTPNIAASGSKTYTFTLQNTSPGGSTPLVHIYSSSGTGFFTSPDSSYTVGSPALADRAIAVGAWTQRRSWVTATGTTTTYSFLTLDTLAPFSSRGPRIDGVVKPEIVAPGAATISARESVGTLASSASTIIDNDGINNVGPANYYVMQGTSMASPLAAGSAALVLQSAPSLSPNQLKIALTSTASNAASPNRTIGSGLIDVLASVQSVDVPPPPPSEAPVLTPEPLPLIYVENQGAAAVSPGFELTLSNGSTLSGGTVAITSGHSSAQDALALFPTPQNGIFANYNASAGVLTLTGTSSVANYRTALRAITYTNSSRAPTPLNRTLTFTLFNGTPSGTATRAINITAINDPPTASNLSVAETFTEDFQINLTDVVITDNDSPTVSASLTLSATAAGALSTATSGTVTSSFNPQTGVWTASGPLADVNALLAGVSFYPAENFAQGFTIATSINDGSTTLNGTKSFTAIPVNDGATATNLAAAEVYFEDSPLNLIDIVASDVDSANITASLTLSPASAGALSTGTSGSVTSTYNPGSGVWTAFGPIGNVNTLLANLTFAPILNTSGSCTISTSVTDNLAPPATGLKIVTGTPVNDPPSALQLSTATVAENNPALATVGALTTSDVDAGDTHSFSLLAGPGGADNSSFSISEGTLRINSPANFETKASYQVLVRATDSGAPGLTFDQAFTITITDGNDAPTAIALSPTSIAENSLATAPIGALSTTDEDSGSSATFALVSGAGDADNAKVSLAGNLVKLAVSPDFEGQSAYQIRVRATDNGSQPLSYEQSLTVGITNVNEVPTFTKGDDFLLEPGDTQAKSFPGWATAIQDGDQTVTQGLNFTVIVQTGSALFSTPPALSSGGDLTFTPSGESGTATVAVTLTDDTTVNGNAALTTPTQTFTVTSTRPILTLAGNSTNIANGDDTPSPTDGTSFGEMTVASGSVSRTFTILNTGDGSLTISSLALSGPAASDFAITTNPSTPLAALTGTTSLQVSFDPSALGTRTAVLTLRSNDRSRDPFVFHLSGIGTAPEITVDSETVVDLTDGASTVAFGDVLLGEGTTQTFTIRNTGTASLTGLTVSASASAPTTITVEQPELTSLAPNSHTTFRATLAPGALGARTASLQIGSNDADESEFDFVVIAIGVAPEISVEDEPGASLISGVSRIDLGSVAPESTVSTTLTIRNLGTAPLRSLSVSVSGSEFSATQPSMASIPPGGNATFELTFHPTGLAARTGTLQILSSDADESVFSLLLSGVSDHRVAKALTEPESATPSTPLLEELPWDAAAAGLYDGLLFAQSDPTELIGAISSLQLSPPRAGTNLGGTLSGSMILNGRVFALRGAFDVGGIYSAFLPQTDGTTLAITLQLVRCHPDLGYAIQGTVSWNGLNATVILPKAPFHATLNPLPAPLAATGAYTFVVPSLSGSGALEPGGDGWATATLNASGTLSLTGTLGDGTRFTETAYLSTEGTAALSIPLYATNPGKGWLGARLTFRNLPSVSDFDGPVRWLKGLDTRAPQRERLYPNGFDLQLTGIGNRYLPPTVDQRALSQLANQHHNAEVSLIGVTAPATSTGALDKIVSWLSSNQIVHYGPQRLSGSARPPTGGVVGSFTDAGSRIPVSFSGVVLQKQGLVAGHFVHGSASGALRILPGTGFSLPGVGVPGPLARIASPSAAATAPVESSVPFEAAAAGTYHGILTQSGPVTGGLEMVKITATGAASGSLWVQGVRQSFQGSIGNPIIASGGAQLLLTLSKIDGPTDGFGLQGSVTIGSINHTIDAQRQPIFSAASPAPWRGRYTMIVAAPDGTNPALSPAGNGFGAVTVSPLGACTGFVTLADGTKVTLGGATARDYLNAGGSISEWSFHRGLYGAVPRGFVAGKLTFRTNAEGLSDLDGSWRWIKQNGAPPLLVYGAGFDVTYPVVGSLYLPPTANVRAMNGLVDEDYNIWARFSGPDLSTLPAEITTIDRVATWSRANKLTYYGPETLTLTFVPTTGLLSGGYTDTANGIRITFGGALLQDQDLLSGHTVSSGQSGLFSIEGR